MLPFLDLKAQYLSIKSEIDFAVQQVFDSCQFVLGEQVEKFEAEFAAYTETKYAIGVNSGTSALHLALLAGGIRQGHEVITVAHTFAATAAAIRYVGAIPVFVDIDPQSCNIDPAKIESVITPQTRAIMPVHLYGQCADMDPILATARRHNLLVIEDAAQAHGAIYKKRRAGSMGDLSCFSFYPGKNLGAYGEGGAIVTNDLSFAEKIRALRDHGQNRKYHHQLLGYNYRLEGIQGAVLRVKLRHLDEWNARRRRHASIYRQLMASAPVALLEEREYGIPVYHIFPVFSAHRDDLQRYLKELGIETGIHYPVPLHEQPVHADLGYRRGAFPHTECIAATTLSLPMYPELDEGALEAISDAVCRFEATRVAC